MTYLPRFSAPLTYIDFGTLEEFALSGIPAMPDKVNKKKLEMRVKSLKTADAVLHKALMGNDEELAYIYAIRYMKLFVSIGKHSREYLDGDTWFAENKVIPTVAMNWAEALTKSLTKRYEAAHKTANPVPVMPPENGQALREITNVDGLTRTDRSKSPGLSSSKSNGFGNFDEQTEISPGELQFLLKKNGSSVLVIDIRDSHLFDASHVVCSNFINIPGERLADGHLTVSRIEDIIDPQFLALWRGRHTFETVVIVDKEGHRSKAVIDLISVMTEYSSDRVENTPLLLSHGFYGLINRLPHMTSDPYHQPPAVPHFKPRIIDIRYPSRSIFNDYRDPVSPEIQRKTPQRTDSYGFEASDASSNDSAKNVLRQPSHVEMFPQIEVPVVPPVSFHTDSKRSLEVPRPMANIPVANRLTKPSQSTTSTGGLSVAASKSENSFDAGVNNSNGSSRRSSVEVRGESSDEEMKKPAARSVPAVPKSAKPVNGIPETRPPQSKSENCDTNGPPPKQNGFASAPEPPSSFKIIGDVQPAPKPLPTPPPPAKPSAMAPKPSETNGPKVVNIPIVVDRPSAPSVDEPPKVLRTLKPKENLPSTVLTLLPPIPHPDLLVPFELATPQRLVGCTGLVNIGNSCYMNSVLQCLAHTRAIREYYKTGEFKQDVNFSNRRGTKGKISVYMAELMRLMWSGVYKSFAPRFMKICLGEHYELFRGSAQQDGFEALIAILDLLHQDTNNAELVGADSATRIKRLKIEDAENLPSEILAVETFKRHKLVTNSVIDTYFTFLQENVVQCGVCGHESCTFTSDQMLILGLGDEPERSRYQPQIELTDLMARAMQSDGSQIEWRCPRCKRDRNASQRYYLHSAPRILAVQLKRFQNDGTQTWKDDRPVNFPPELSLKPFYKNAKAASRDQLQYRLYAVIDHFGALNSGHYTASVLHFETKQWLNCNDANVTQIKNEQDVVSPNAYVLFYEQMYFGN